MYVFQFLRWYNIFYNFKNPFLHSIFHKNPIGIIVANDFLNIA